MKKVFTTLAILLLIGSSAFAQRSTVRVKNVSPFEHIPFHVAYFGKSEAGIDIISPISLGVNVLTGSNFEVDPSRSRTFAWTPVTIYASLSDQITFTTGLRWSYINLVAEDDRIPSTEYILPLGNTIRKAKVESSYLGVPVGFKARTNGIIYGANISAEILTGSHYKYKTSGDDSKSRYKAANPFRSTIMAYFGYEWLGLYASYSLTPFFKDDFSIFYDNGNVLSVGLIFDIF